MRIAARLGFTYRTDPAEIEDMLRGNIERRVRREAAREILDLAKADAKLSHIHKGPWGDVEISVKRMARGEPLPDVSELRGGSGA